MYEKWLQDDGQSLALTSSQIREITAQLEAVRQGHERNAALLGDKEVALSQKDTILSVRACPPARAALHELITHRLSSPL